MKSRLLAALFFLGCWFSIPYAMAASDGYQMVGSHGEIVAKAKKEAKLNVISSLDGGTFKPMMQSLRRNTRLSKCVCRRLAGPKRCSASSLN